LSPKSPKQPFFGPKQPNRRVSDHQQRVFDIQQSISRPKPPQQPIFESLAVAFEEIDGDDFEAEGNGFELIGLLAIYDPPREDTKQTIDDAVALGVRVKMVTGDQLAIAKETGRRLGLGDHMYPAKVLKDGPAPGGKHASLDEMIMDADGFAGVFPEHKYEIVKRLQGLGHLCAMTGDGANDAPALSRANVGIAVEGATDAARGAADIVLTEPGLSTIVHAIRQSRVIFQRMRNYSIYACAVTIRIVVSFAILSFAYKYDFPPFMILIIALLNVGTIMTLSVDKVLPSLTPDSWDLAEIFSFAVAYGLYLTLSTYVLFSSFFFLFPVTDQSFLYLQCRGWVVHIAIGPFFIVDAGGDGVGKGKKVSLVIKTLGKFAMRGLCLSVRCFIFPSVLPQMILFLLDFR